MNVGIKLFSPRLVWGEKIVGGRMSAWAAAIKQAHALTGFLG